MARMRLLKASELRSRSMVLQVFVSGSQRDTTFDGFSLRRRTPLPAAPWMDLGEILKRVVGAS